MIRNAAVAGQFYPGSKLSLEKELASLTDSSKRKEDAIAVISPHAGYVYSGGVAGEVFSSIKPKKYYIIIGPNHTGLGVRFGIDGSQAWKTPLGEVTLDDKLSLALKKSCKYLEFDSLSHESEHSIEVQLPFLQYLVGGFKFVPIVISQGSLDLYREIGVSISSTIKELHLEKDFSIVASSDMTHYESHETAKRKDSIAIDDILRMDEGKLYNDVGKYDITMCGYGPAVIALAAAKALGATQANLIKYQTSGDSSGDYSSVVGYAGIIIS